MWLDFFIISVLCLTGIGLILLEIFFIHGFGIAGIGGIAFMGGSIWFAYGLSPISGHIALAVNAILLLLAIYWFVKGKALTKISLNRQIEGKAPNAIKAKIESGQIATTLSVINPMGKIVIEGNVLEAKSKEGFIEVNRKVRVLKVNSTNVIIEEIKD